MKTRADLVRLAKLKKLFANAKSSSSSKTCCDLNVLLEENKTYTLSVSYLQIRSGLTNRYSSQIRIKNGLRSELGIKGKSQHVPSPSAVTKLQFLAWKF